MSSSPVSGFSRLYIEREAASEPHGRQLIARFRGKPVIEIDSASHVFSRGGQFPALQRRRPALIATRGRGPFLHRAPGLVSGDTDLPVYYTDQLRNCVFSCDYCFLQGMHPSGHLLVDVNSTAYHQRARELSSVSGIWLSISYLSDILGFEEVLPLVTEWVESFREEQSVTIEVRTKGALPAALKAGAPSRNLVLVWTLSPKRIARQYESGAASTRARVNAARKALRLGYRVRVAIDPVILTADWQNDYRELLDTFVAPLAAEGAEGGSYGAFRMSAPYLERIRRERTDSPIVHYAFARQNGIATYAPDELRAVDELVGSRMDAIFGGGRVVRHFAAPAPPADGTPPD